VYFLLTLVPGPAWDDARGIRDQDGWDEHAAFMDSLVAEGVVVVGGPVGPGHRTAHLVQAPDTATVRTRFAADPWARDRRLEIGALDTWSLWLDGRARGRRHEASIVVERPADEVYDLVSDVTRTGEWSPICEACWWDEPEQGAAVGAQFTGRNVTPDRTWETRSRVVVADRGREFAWEVANGFVRWGYVLEPVGAGTRLTETWHFTPVGLAGFAARYGDDAPAQIENRTEAARSGIPATLAAIKRVAEQAS
jgi:hypothetical protein